MRTLLLVTVLGVVLVVLLYVRFGPRLRRIRARHAFMAVAVVFFAAVVALFTAVTIDLGPSLRGQAERAGSNYLKRTMTIGRLSIHLWTGKFIVEDLVTRARSKSNALCIRSRSCAPSFVRACWISL